MRFACLPSFLSSNVQAANIKFELANELYGKCAYVEAMKLYEEARDMFVQVYLTVAVLNTVMAAVAPLKGCCRAALPSVTQRRATGVACPNRQCHMLKLSRGQGGEGLMKMRKFLFYTP